MINYIFYHNIKYNIYIHIFVTETIKKFLTMIAGYSPTSINEL